MSKKDADKPKDQGRKGFIVWDAFDRISVSAFDTKDQAKAHRLAILENSGSALDGLDYDPEFRYAIVEVPFRASPQVAEAEADDGKKKKKEKKEKDGSAKGVAA